MPRNGQWVKTEVEFPLPGDAFKTRGGLAVGIFVRQRSESPHDSYVQLVDINGDNLMIEIDMIEISKKTVPMNLNPKEFHLIPITDRRDIPEKRVAHMPKGWNPEA